MARLSATGGRASKAKAGRASQAKGRKTARTSPNDKRRRNAERETEVAGLKRELKEALARQTATSEVLRVISQSPTDTQPVFEAIVLTAVRLLHCDMSIVMLCEPPAYWVAAAATPEGLFDELTLIKQPIDPRANFPSRTIVEKRALYLPDWSLIDLPEHERHIHETVGVNSALYLPLMREGECIGLLTLGGKQANMFGESEIALAESFCDQALIAIENTRLFHETREALEQQKASADILSVISNSVADPKPVFDRILRSIEHLFDGQERFIFQVGEDGLLHIAAAHGPNVERLRALFPIPVEGTANEQAIRERRLVRYADVLNDPGVPSGLRETARRFGQNYSMVVAPMLWENRAIGSVFVGRTSMEAFSDKECELLRTFADQAVIAIQNARMFDEVQAKTRDLTESLQQQTATADVLKVISRSAFDLQTVFNTLIDSAVALSGALSGTICLRDGDGYRYAATSSDMQSDFAKWLFEHPPTRGRASAAGRVLVSGKVEEVPDILEDPDYTLPVVSLNRTRSVIGVPLLGKDRLEGVLALTRAEPGHFTQRQIELVQTFADQAVIAIENVRLFDEVQARTKELAASLDDLRTAQDRQVQTEKLASLGQLTAGIAHEIKNPLNFVNNFSALSAELIDELDETLAPAPLDQKMRGDVGELTQMLKSNLEKVVQHGKRADSIVKNMLLHSREGSGEHRSADVNALVEESLNLAYHGARAEKPGFNVILKRDLDPDAGAVELYPQEITRALLNLISNGFYAATQRKSVEGETFEPVLIATTKNRGKTVEIRIRDNGTGIPDEVKEKMFNPFFTTKPTGEGTGLGLSMSHDIIVKQHGGSIDVETAPGFFTEFKIVLPRTSQR